MKKAIILWVLIGIFSLTIGKSAISAQTDSVSESVDKVLNQLREEKTDALSEIREALHIYDEDNRPEEQSDEPDLFKSSSYDLEGAYKAYTLGSRLVTSYKEKGSLQAIAEETYQWKIPYANTSGMPGFATIGEEDGKLILLGKSSGETCNNEMISEDVIRSAIADSDLIKKPLTSITIYNCLLYNVYFVTLSDGADEFVIPFSVRPDWAPVKNGVLYSAEELIEKYDKMYDEDSINPKASGGVPLQGQGEGIILGKNIIHREETPNELTPTPIITQESDMPDTLHEESEESAFPIVPTVALGGGVALFIGLIVLLKKRH